LAVLALLAVAGHGQAKWPKLRIVKDSIRIGIPPGRSAGERDDTGAAAHVFKLNQWAPIYFDVEILDIFDDPKTADAYLTVETQDGDAYTTKYRLPLGNLAGRNPGEKISSIEFRWTPYVRMGGYPGECKLSMADAQGRAFGETETISQLRPVDSNQYVVMSLGSKLASFDVRNPDGDDAKTKKLTRVTSSSILEISQMPDQWIGYDAIDMAIIGTAGTKDFVPTLFGEPGEKNPAIRQRRDALLEWVRRGGRLVISVGTNAAVLSQYKALQDLLPLPIDPANPKADYPAVTLVGPPAATGRDGILKPKDGTVPVAGLRPVKDRAVRVLMSGTYLNNPVGQTVPLIAQSPFGLGRITVVAFDLDRSPFVDYLDRSAVWVWLLKECGSQKAVTGQEAKVNNNPNQPSMSASSVTPEDDFATGIQRDLDRFEGVPVISFGWVALFVILYTLVIGPLEYIILKKVFKRLELTWITFPIIVLTVSVISYYSAYALKGSDLKINKFDVIDVDVSGQRLYGRTWVSLFSPRQESFTISVTPNTGWAIERPAGESAPTLVDWVHGSRGSSRQSIFRSSYAYHVDPDPSAPKFADALIDVPIKVWSVKSLSANWAADTDPAVPLVESKLIHPPADPTTVAGNVTLRLPVGKLTDSVMIYGDKVYKLGDIESGVPYQVVLDDSKVDPQWFSTAGNLSGLGFVLQGGDEFRGRWGGNLNQGPNEPGNLSFWGALFHEKALGGGMALSNSSIRKIDQSWRAEKWNTNEAMIVARLPVAKGEIDTVLNGGSSISPTQLWLKSLPKPGTTRQAIAGKIRQETYVRLIVPIKPNVK
jgi:hypothetical protein